MVSAEEHGLAFPRHVVPCYALILFEAVVSGQIRLLQVSDFDVSRGAVLVKREVPLVVRVWVAVFVPFFSRPFVFVHPRVLLDYPEEIVQGTTRYFTSTVQMLLEKIRGQITRM